MQALLAQQSKYFWLPRQASTVAGGTDDLFNIILWLCVFFFLLVTVLLVVFVIKYRHKPGEVRDVSASHSMTLELTWTIIPSILMVFLYYYGFKEYMNLAVEPPNSYEVTATGRMWQWSFTYPNGYADGELHVPVNTPVRVVLQSDDVIHSLFVPEFRVKKDVVPGRYNRLWFQPTVAEGLVYVTEATLDGKPSEVAVDAEGRPLYTSSAQTPSQETIPLNAKSIPTPVSTALKGQAAADAPLRVISMLDGTVLYFAHAGDPKTELVLDAKGTQPASEAVQFNSLPWSVQSGLKSQAGADIPAGQTVRKFLDAEAFDVYCAAYCGTNHSTMRSRVIVHRSRQNFEAWLAVANVLTGTPAEIGQKLYGRLGCAGCHSVDGTKVVGPTWRDLFGSTQQFTDGSSAVVDAKYVHAFLPNPTAKVPVGFNPVMPPFVLKDEQVDDLIAYMQTISKNYHAASIGGPGVAPTTLPTSAPATQPSTEPAK